MVSTLYGDLCSGIVLISLWFPFSAPAPSSGVLNNLMSLVTSSFYMSLAVHEVGLIHPAFPSIFCHHSFISTPYYMSPCPVHLFIRRLICYLATMYGALKRFRDSILYMILHSIFSFVGTRLFWKLNLQLFSKLNRLFSGTLSRVHVWSQYRNICRIKMLRLVWAEKSLDDKHFIPSLRKPHITAYFCFLYFFQLFISNFSLFSS